MKMPGIGGIEATKRLKLVDGNIKVVVVTSCEGELYPSKLMRAGANAYITKKSTPEEMIEAIDVAIAGNCFLSKDVTQKLAAKNMYSWSRCLLWWQTLLLYLFWCLF